MMSDEIDSRGRKKDPSIARLFVQRPKEPIPMAASEESRATVSNSPIEDSDTRTGVVANTNVDKGYGFIRPDGGGDNMFFHVKALVDCELAELSPGSTVAFNVIGTDRGPNAVAVRRRGNEAGV
jgi:CspA family cold shock protein